VWVFRKSVKGNTALHDCAESGSLEIMKLLIASGARIDVDAYGGFLLIRVVDPHWGFSSVPDPGNQNT
jgi:ankyrin repeat protein